MNLNKADKENTRKMYELGVVANALWSLIDGEMAQLERLSSAGSFFLDLLFQGVTVT